MRLTSNFTLEELAKTSAPYDNTVKDTEVLVALTALCCYVLQPVRDFINMPITVNSGYRCGLVNKHIGGATNSQHMKGEAADITLGSKAKNKSLFEIIRTSAPFDQLIDENDYQWIHVSYKRCGGNRKQVLHLKNKDYGKEILS